MQPFSAVLLAGGRSQRMGRDKALLPLADGRPLWQRQLAVLQQLGPAEILFSGPPREGLPPAVRVLEDRTPGLGPLAGFAQALEAMTTERLVALAVDLPQMTPEFLAGLLARCRAGAGIAPRLDGQPEMLAAVYPSSVRPLVWERLAAPDRSLRAFAWAAAEAGLLEFVDVTPAQAPLFLNWNRPDDYNFQRPA